MDCTEATSAKQKCPEKITRSRNCAGTRTTDYSKATNRKLPRRFGEQGDEPSSCKLELAMSGAKEGRKNVDYLPVRSVRISFAASTFAGLSKFGLSEDKSDITLNNYDRKVR